MDKKPVLVTLLNMLISVMLTTIGSVSELPFGIVAGLTAIFVIIAILAAALGTILALMRLRRAWIIGLLLSIFTVPALIYYSRLLARGGLTLTEVIFAGVLYFYIFLVVFFVLTYLENVLGHFIPQGTQKTP
jgi:hypothetical protein